MTATEPPQAPVQWLGRAVPRREDVRFVTGAARYSGDFRPEGVLWAAFVRSPIASATNLKVDVTAAVGGPGVVGAFTAADLRLKDIPGSGGPGRPEAPEMPRPPLAKDRIRYVGEPLAVVVAEDAYSAVDALELVDVVFDDAVVVASVEQALQDTDLLFEGAGTNVVHRATAGADGVDVNARPKRVTVEVVNQRVSPVPIEPLAFLAEPGPDRRLTVHCGHQAPHRLKRQLALQLGIEVERIRVVVPDTGGGFGMKAMLYPEYPITAALALRLGRPVLWQQTRSEMFMGGTHGRGMRSSVTLEGDDDGRVHAASVELLADVGAYPHNGSGVPLFTSYMAPGPYDIQQVSVSTTMVVTNRAPTGSYRGAGRPEATYALERAMDAFARQVGLDPEEVRRRNLIRPEQMPYRSATGALYDGGDYRRALDRALELADADEVRRQQALRLAAGENPIGLGMAVFVERAGGDADSTEYGRVEVTDDGEIIARTGSSAAGQGHETVFSQVVASVFGMTPDDVTVIEGDTDAVASGTGSFASRSLQIGGSALHIAAQRVKQCACETAADLLNVQPGLIDALPGGSFAARTDPTKKVSLAEAAVHGRARGAELMAEEEWSAHAQTFPYGACVVVVEVDLETGRIEVQKVVAVDDCGKVINPLIVEGQVHGSLLQGIAQALFEGIDYDQDGQPRTSSLVDYAVPTAPDAPAFTTDRIVTPAPSNPLGAKGAGESGCIGAPPAVVNAVLDALAPHGVSDLHMPLTPEHVWRAISEGRREER